MKKLWMAAVLILGTLLGIWTFSHGSWIAVPLAERVKQADLIVVGELRDITEKHFSITYYKKESSGKEAGSAGFYNLGELEVNKILKGSEEREKIPLAFPSRVQTDPAGVIGRSVSTGFSLSRGQQGIWLLQKDRLFTGFFVIVRPDNFLPIDALEEVKKVLK